MGGRESGMPRKGLLCAVSCVLIVGVAVQAPAMAKKKITWWVPLDSSMKAVHDKFEKENPGVDIQMVTGDMDKFYTMITAGLMPDIWGPWGTPGIHADVNRNWATDLTPYIKRDGKAMGIDDFFPGVMRQFKIAGKQFSLPVFSSADYYAYNTQLLAQAGLNPPPLDASDKDWDWDRMLMYAQKTTIKDNSGKNKQFGLNFSTGLADFPNYFHMWGAEPYSEDTLRTSVPQAMHWTTPEMVKGITKVWELRWRYNVAGGDFLTSKTAATIEHGYNISNWVKAKKLKWAIAPLPWAVTNAGTLWPDGWRISRVCKEKELAWKFVKFICSPDMMRLIVTDAKGAHIGRPVTRKSIFKETFGREIQSVTAMDAADVYKVHEQADEVGIVKYQETVCLHLDLEKYINPELEKIWTNKVAPKEGATNIQRVVDKTLPILFARWVRNVKFTGADRNF